MGANVLTFVVTTALVPSPGGLSQLGRGAVVRAEREPRRVQARGEARLEQEDVPLEREPRLADEEERQVRGEARESRDFPSHGSIDVSNEPTKLNARCGRVGSKATFGRDVRERNFSRSRGSLADV